MTPDSARRLSGMPAINYHAMHALSASGGLAAAEECAAKFLWRSPWTPLYVPEAKTDFDVGVAAHLAVLEPHRQADSVVLIEAGDYRTTKAREARDAARASGKVPLLPYQFDIVRAIAGSIRAHPIASQAFTGGEAEVTLIWDDAVTGYSVQGTSRLPADAWALDGRSEDRGVGQSPELARSGLPPWLSRPRRLVSRRRRSGARASTGGILVRHRREGAASSGSVVSFDHDALAWGRTANRKACERFACAAAANDWPSYREPGQNHDRAFRIGLPPWAIYQLQDRQEAGEFTPEPPPELGWRHRAERFFAVPDGRP